MLENRLGAKYETTLLCICTAKKERKTRIGKKQLIMVISCVAFGCRNRQRKSNKDKNKKEILR